jgi:hypothetical protein
MNHQGKMNLIETETCYSQASQDKFVYLILCKLLGQQNPGCYLEIGAGEPILINNTYFFEKNLKWNGVSIDISRDLEPRWYAVRQNRLLTADAITTDYSVILQSFPKVIDYLSLDVDGYYVDVLKRIPFRDYTFKVITIEHDYYRFGDLYRLEERQFLESCGYHLLCPDVKNGGYSFEDWWIHPSFFSTSEFSLITSVDFQGKEHTQLIQIIQDALVKK